MRDEMKKVPRLRFRGFQEDWELCKLKEITERVKGNDGRMDLPTLTISASQGWLNQKDRFSGNIAGKEQKNYTLLLKNELSYNHGNSKLAKYGAVFSLKTYEEALVPRVYHSFKSTKNSDPDFLEYIFATKKPDKELGKLVSSGARMDGLLNINYDDFSNIKINIPHVHEQKKISNLLRKIDDTIALHQRKLDQLKELKKAYLQLMFPKKDETVPQVRFADSGVKFVSVENIATLETKKYITHEAYEKEYSKKRAKKGDILMTRIGDIGTMKVIETDEPLAYYVTLALLKAKETNPYFLSFIISSPEIQRNIWKRTLHIAFPKKINLGEINQVEMKITIFEEQDKIGDLFTNLDDAIILNQNKLNQLKSLKKSYLQNMFI